MIVATLKRVVRLAGLDVVHYREPAPGVMATDAKVVSARHGGHEIRFLVSNPNDHIQREHLGGRFYEIEELDLI